MMEWIVGHFPYANLVVVLVFAVLLLAFAVLIVKAMDESRKIDKSGLTYKVDRLEKIISEMQREPYITFKHEGKYYRCYLIEELNDKKDEK